VYEHLQSLADQHTGGNMDRMASLILTQQLEPQALDIGFSPVTDDAASDPG
jgi:hypothetical protein